MKKSLSLFLVLMLLLTMSVPVYADGIIGNIEMETEIYSLTDLNVRILVNRYFSQRTAYLQGSANSIPIAHERRMENETQHKEALQDANAEFSHSVFEIESIHIGDGTAWVTGTETVTYLINGQQLQESIFHELLVEKFLGNSLIIRTDGYLATVPDFASASYRDPAMAPDGNGNSINAIGTGSSLCIIAVANSQLGYTESADGYTKYGDWYSDYESSTREFQTEPWCAMFVSWCAYHANVPNSSILKTHWVPDMRNQFANQGRLKTPSYTPVAGDLIFTGGTYSSPNHVGIVTGVSGAYIHYIDGNNPDKNVHASYISYNAESIVAFGKTSYPSTTHTGTWSYNDSRHWRYCTNCDTYQSGVHSTYIDGGQIVCSVCGYVE